MLKQLSVALVALFISAGAVAEATTAKVVVYRADEATKTQRINFSAAVDKARMGRVKYDRPVVLELEAGDYEFSTTLAGTEPLAVTLSAGGTYYLHANVEKIGRTVMPTLVLVEEQVAVTQKPELNGAI